MRAGGKPDAASPTVKLVQQGEAFHLTRSGETYLIKGAGGDGSKELLRACGGNSVRTWGVDKLGAVLDDAQKHGLTVTAGIWLGHKEHGFDYNNADQVAGQYEKACEAIKKFRSHPALLMWAIGNEMEVTAGADNAAVWSAVNNVASAAHRLDPDHPTMTVVAEIGGNKVKNINRLCPDVDVIGINSYGGGPSVAQRYRQAGGVKPYVLTEYGPAGVWEVGRNGWGAFPELSSTEKAEAYRKTYVSAIASQPLCLGGYAFTWGNKQEATATWFGLLLPDGRRLGAVDALTELWTGKPPANLCPRIDRMKVDGPDQVPPGGTVRVKLSASDPEHEPLHMTWLLQADSTTSHSNGDAEAVPAASEPQFANKFDGTGAEIIMPKVPGAYRLFAYVRDDHGGAAVANVPLLVMGPPSNKLTATKPARLPFVVYDEADRIRDAYAPSGYMGATSAIKMDMHWSMNPHAGKTCIRAQYLAKDNWGGVVWQDPPNDWGDKPGGKNLTGAQRLTFWARGEEGGETLSFLCGLVKRDKPYSDSLQEKLDRIALGKDWRMYTIDLRGKDLSRVKTPFAWTVAATGAPVTFYLDDIRFE